jgi:hypothetical protein
MMAGEDTAKKIVSGGGFKKVVNRKQEIDEAVDGPPSSSTPVAPAEAPKKRVSTQEVNSKLDKLIADTERRKAFDRQQAEAAKAHLDEEDTVDPEAPKKGGWKYIEGIGRVKVE